MTRPVVVRVSQATRLYGSFSRQASRMASEIWSAILSGWPSVTDSEVNKKFRKASLKTISPSCFSKDPRFFRELVILEANHGIHRRISRRNLLRLAHTTKAMVIATNHPKLPSARALRQRIESY